MNVQLFASAIFAYVVCFSACSGDRVDVDERYAREYRAAITSEISSMIDGSNVDISEFEEVWSLTVDEYANCLVQALLSSNRPESSRFLDALMEGSTFDEIERELSSSSLEHQEWENEIKLELKICGRSKSGSNRE